MQQQQPDESFTICGVPVFDGSPPPPPATGFPQHPQAPGQQRVGAQLIPGASSADLCKHILSEALAANSPAAARAARTEKNWRQRYYKHIVSVAEVSAASAEAAVRVAARGLEEARSVVQWVAEEGGAPTDLFQAVKQAATSDGPCALTSLVVRGTGTSVLEVPYKGQSLALGSHLTAQVEKWVKAGMAEPSAAASLERLAAMGPVKLGTVLDEKVFVILGAGGEMCPTEALLKAGATVCCVDLPNPRTWARLIAVARASSGTLVMPMRGGASHDQAGMAQSDEAYAEAAGVDLLKDTCDIAKWIGMLARAAPEVCLGSFVYLDGAKFVEVSLACDAIIAATTEGADNVSLAFLASPTEVFAVPEERVQEQARRFQQPSLHQLWYKPLSALSRGRYLEQNKPIEVPQASGGSLHLQDSAVWQQGPNYSMAKLLHRWRAILHWSTGGVVSANVAPASLTRSVLHNPLVAAGMYGCAHFGIEPFETRTVSSLMALLLICDVAIPESCANSRSQAGQSLASPLELLQHNAVHGGTWCTPFKTNSYTEVCAALHFLGKAKPYVAAAAVVGAASLGYKGFRARL